jgi:hypothetical protein
VIGFGSIFYTNKLVEELKERVEGIEEEKLVLQKVKISSGNQGVKPKTDKKSSKYVGVYWDRSRNKWSAEITFKRKKIYIGRFTEEDEAGRAYDRKALELYGEEAKFNFRGGEKARVVLK